MRLNHGNDPIRWLPRKHSLPVWESLVGKKASFIKSLGTIHGFHSPVASSFLPLLFLRLWPLASSFSISPILVTSWCVLFLFYTNTFCSGLFSISGGLKCNLPRDSRGSLWTMKSMKNSVFSEYRKVEWRKAGWSICIPCVFYVVLEGFFSPTLLRRCPRTQTSPLAKLQLIIISFKTMVGCSRWLMHMNPTSASHAR